MSMESARKKAGLLQREVAGTLNVSMGTVAMWDTGRNLPRASLLPKVAELYHCTIAELLTAIEALSDGDAAIRYQDRRRIANTIEDLRKDAH